MKKDNVMFGVIGLLLGLIVGFIATNWMNRSALTSAPIATATDTSGGSNSSLPPNHPPIGTNGGTSDGGAAQIAQVQQAIEKAKQNPQDYEAQMTAADLYYQIQRFDDAAKYYEAASALKPNEKEAMIKAGNAYFDKAETAAENGNKAGSTPDFVKAEQWYTQALARDPKDIDVRTDLGLTFFLRDPRDIERAIKEYKTSLTIDPRHEITLQNLALAYKEKGDTASYQTTADLLRTVNPDNPIFTKGTQSVQP